MEKTLSNDQYILITSKSGESFAIHELYLEFEEGESLQTVFNDILKAKETGSFFRKKNLFIDTGQIAFVLLDERKYLE